MLPYMKRIKQIFFMLQLCCKIPCRRIKVNALKHVLWILFFLNLLSHRHAILTNTLQKILVKIVTNRLWLHCWNPIVPIKFHFICLMYPQQSHIVDLKHPKRSQTTWNWNLFILIRHGFEIYWGRLSLVVVIITAIILMLFMLLKE